MSRRCTRTRAAKRALRLLPLGLLTLSFAAAATPNAIEIPGAGMEITPGDGATLYLPGDAAAGPDRMAIEDALRGEGALFVIASEETLLSAAAYEDAATRDVGDLALYRDEDALALRPGEEYLLLDTQTHRFLHAATAAGGQYITYKYGRLFVFDYTGNDPRAWIGSVRFIGEPAAQPRSEADPSATPRRPSPSVRQIPPAQDAPPQTGRSILLITGIAATAAALALIGLIAWAKWARRREREMAARFERDECGDHDDLHPI